MGTSKWRCAARGARAHRRRLWGLIGRRTGRGRHRGSRRGQTYYTFGYTVAYATNRPLYSFEPGDADTPVPDLAEFEPRISPDNRAITVKLRAGVRISPPVNREVTAADVKYAFERAFTQAVPSGYAIDEAMNRASTIPAGPERNRAWAEINRRIVSQAPANPYSWDDSFQLASKDVQGVMNGYTATWDLVFSSLR